MKVFLNENTLEVNAPISLTNLLEGQNVMDSRGIAVAINNQVISKSNWAVTTLKENDKIIIITATAGG